MTFVDTNVFLYALGREHALRQQARRFFLLGRSEGRRLCTSSEVEQELLHVTLRRGGQDADVLATFALVDATMSDVWSVEREDVRLAGDLAVDHCGLAARDLVHLACCIRRGVHEVKTFDRALGAAAARLPRPMPRSS